MFVATIVLEFLEYQRCLILYEVLRCLKCPMSTTQVAEEMENYILGNKLSSDIGTINLMKQNSAH